VRRPSPAQVAVGLALWAAAVRAAAVFHALQLPFLDKYPQAAALLLDGSLGGERLLDFSPLYLALSTALAWGGVPVRVGLLVLQAAAGVVATLVAFTLARRWGGLAAGVLAGLLVASGRMVVVGGAILEPEIWLGLGILAGLLWVLDGRWMMAGTAFGLAALVRPNALVVPLVLLALSFAGRRLGLDVRPRQAVRVAAEAVIAVGLLLVFWLGGVPAADWPALMSPGQVFHQGNARDASGFGIHYPPSVAYVSAVAGDGPDFEHQAYRDVARADTGRCLSAAEAEGFWRGKALAAVAERPAAALGRAGLRLAGLFSRHQVWDVAGAAALEERMGIWAPVEMPLLLPLALLGFLLPPRRRLVLLLPALLVPLSTGGVFFASGRHRLLLDLLLAVAAGVGGARLLDRLNRTETLARRGPAAVLAVVVVGGALPFVPLPPVERGRTLVALDQAARQSAALAGELWRRGETGAAREAAAGAVVLAVDRVPELPPTLRADPGFPRRTRELARQMVAGGSGPVVARAAAALVAFGGCAELDEALTRRAGPVDPADAAALAVAGAACDLRRGTRHHLSRLEELAAVGELPIEGHAFLTTARLGEGESIGSTLAGFPRSYDRYSVLRAFAQAARAGDRETAAVELEERLAGVLVSPCRPAAAAVASERR
jgi:hypothetical protein